MELKLRELKLRKSFLLWCCGRRMEIYLVYGFAKRRKLVMKGKYAKCVLCKKEKDASPKRIQLMRIDFPSWMSWFGKK